MDIVGDYKDSRFVAKKLPRKKNLRLGVFLHNLNNINKYNNNSTWAIHVAKQSNILLEKMRKNNLKKNNKNRP